MSFSDHLEELRSRLIRVLVGAVIGLVVCFVFRARIMGWLVAPLDVALASQGQPRHLTALQPAEPFVVVFKMCFVCGLILSAPWGLWQIWAFVAAGLYKHERRFVQRMAPASIGLFALGVLFLFYVVLPVVLNFLISVRSWVPEPQAKRRAVARWLVPEAEEAAATSQPRMAESVLPLLEDDPGEAESGQAWVNLRQLRLKVRIGQETYEADLRRSGGGAFVQPGFALSFYISFVTHLAFGFGVGFQVPIVVVFLGVMGIVSVERMAGGRRYVIFGMVVAAALVTPPDVTSQLLLAGPMVLLYEVGLLAARLMIRRRQAGGA